MAFSNITAFFQSWLVLAKSRSNTTTLRASQVSLAPIPGNCTVSQLHHSLWFEN